MINQPSPIDSRFRPQGRNWPLLYAFVIACGGSTKTTSSTSLAVTKALRGYATTYWDLDANMSGTRVLGYTAKDLKGHKTVLELISGEATFDEVVLPARYWIGTDDDGTNQYQEIPNLRLIPSDPALSGTDTLIALDPDRNDWFMDLLHGYEGDDEVWDIDFPASYGKMVYSVIRMLDEDDKIVPSVRADPKDVNLLPDLLEELQKVREKNRNKRAVPGRAELTHLLLTGTPTPSYDEAPARRAQAAAEALYAKYLLPYIRYSRDAKKLYEDTCPLPILLPKSHPAEDYRKVATHLGFTEKAV